MARRGIILGVALVTTLVDAAAVRAAARPFFRHWTERTHRELDALVRTRRPAPVPVVIKWQAQKQGALELGAPLLATTATDADADGIDELYAVTSAAVVVIALASGRPTIVDTIPFTGARAVPAPRDAVGTAYVDGGVVVAAASPWAQELRIDRRRGQRLITARARGFGVCPGERLSLVPGRNYFGDATRGFVAAVRCRDDLVAADGVPLRVRAQLGVNQRLTVAVQRCDGDTCVAAADVEYGGIGFAFAIADIDRDGTPEVIVAGAGAPGDADAVKVIELGDAEKQGLFRKAFTGGVAGIEVIRRGAALPAQVLAAVRLPGSTRVDLWSLH